MAESPLHDRVERVGGDFFREITVPSDTHLMRWIIHDWADDKAVAILENVRRAAPPGARSALAEWVLSETANLDAGKWMDVNMLVNAGGRERTASEFRTLCDQAGFELEHIILTP